jgi:RecB family endonuclease NucS
MPVQHAISKVADEPTPLTTSRLSGEVKLENMIVAEPRILSGEWLRIGRQEITSHGARTDLLPIAPDGSLVLIELKRDRTPREVIAQALDYASWVETLTPEKIAQIYQRFSGGDGQQGHEG